MEISDPEGPALLAIGASAGGVHAIRELLRLLPDSFTVPIVIVQHLPRGPRLDFNMIYGYRPGRRIVEVEDKMMPRPGDVVMAAPDYHLSVERDGTLSLSQDAPVHYSRPSIDVFFKSVALSYGPRSVGFLMSGANHDGAEGLLHLHRAGAVTLVQDPKEAENATMPNSALALFEPDHVLTLAEAARFLKGRQLENENLNRRRS